MYENSEIQAGGGGGGGGIMYENTKPGAAPPRPIKKSPSGTTFGVGGLTRNAQQMTISSRETSRGSVAYIESVKANWFMPNLNRPQTADFLKGKRPGSFVIRKSSFKPELEEGGEADPDAQFFAISMKKRDRDLWNGLIIYSYGIYTMELEEAKEFKYNDLSELVRGLLSNQDLISVAGLPERLVLPKTGKQ